ncbi:DUF4145 domain-containing protein [Sinorhizobium meliloti]|uniref:DUF4145 domain-containing protein n=1 Tax=Rhizobium meliloti TaxID=382 RepID=UPI0013E2C889|nr:DUF4145 domain-containing protein [Sinorhizobium meliloti]
MGTLRTDTKPFQREEPQHSRLRNRDENYDYEAGRFKGFLRCDRQQCGEIVVVAGSFTTEFHHDFDHEAEQPITHEVTTYRPHLMSPAPEIIQYPKKLNKDSKEHLLRSFVLFWVDYASCANRLRIVVEYLLDQFGIERENAKGDFLNLASRIEKLTKTKPDQADYLNALRWLGNAGSHDGNVDFNDLLWCLDMLEHAMIELFEERDAKRRTEAKRIIAVKGKPDVRR